MPTYPKLKSKDLSYAIRVSIKLYNECFWITLLTNEQNKRNERKKNENIGTIVLFLSNKRTVFELGTQHDATGKQGPSALIRDSLSLGNCPTQE